MGYCTRFTGEITIEPPLQWSQFRDLELTDVSLIVEKDKKEQAKGTLVIKEAVMVVPATDEPFKGYDFTANLQKAVDAAGPDHTFSGYIMGEGEDSGDIRRYSVKDGKVLVQTATFNFDD